MRAMNWQVPFEREMDVSRAAEEREHAEREAHDETEKIEISPGHRTPRAHPCASWSSRRRPYNSVLQRRWRRMPAAFLAPAAPLPRTQDFSQPVSQARRTQNLRQQQHGLA